MIVPSQVRPAEVTHIQLEYSKFLIPVSTMSLLCLFYIIVRARMPMAGSWQALNYIITLLFLKSKVICDWLCEKGSRSC